jgi:hypothetical protein
METSALNTHIAADIRAMLKLLIDFKTGDPHTPNVKSPAVLETLTTGDIQLKTGRWQPYVAIRILIPLW